MNKSDKIYVAGHRPAGRSRGGGWGLVGSAILRKLESEGYESLLVRTHAELDLTDPKEVDAFFAAEKPKFVFLAAAKVGGIQANDTQPADFWHANLLIQLNVMAAAHAHPVEKLLFLGSSCIYPKHAPQPMREEHLLTGKLEPTNDAYAIAKIAGIIGCKSYDRQHGTNTAPLGCAA